MNYRTPPSFFLSTPRKVTVAVVHRPTLIVIFLIFCAEIGHGDLMQFSNATIKPFQDAQLQCMSETMEDKVLWYKKGGSQIEANKDKFVIETVNSTLTILKVGEHDVGEYICQIQGANYSVFVLCEPSVKHFEKSKNLVQGDTLELTCNTWGWPSPSVTWYGKDNVLITSNDRTSFENAGSITNATLKIKDVTLDDYMEYTCSAYNFLASANDTILVRVKDRLAPLWPFLGIVIEVIILIIIIVIYEKRRAKLAAEEAQKDEAECLTNSTEHKGTSESARHRK